MTVCAALAVVLSDLEKIGDADSKDDAAARLEMLMSIRSLVGAALAAATNCPTRLEAVSLQKATLEELTDAIGRQRASFLRDFPEASEEIPDPDCPVCGGSGGGASPMFCGSCSGTGKRKI